MKLSFQNIRFIKSAPTIDERPSLRLPEVVFIGRSNVGKSSLINLLTRQGIAKVSGKPGKTLYLNYFEVDATFYLVDAPGYGYTAHGMRHIDSFAKMMESYFTNNEARKAFVFLLDSRHSPSKDDQDFYNFIKQTSYPIIMVYTKTDKLTQKDEHAFKKGLQQLGWHTNKGIATSTLQRRGYDELKRTITDLLDADKVAID